VFARCAGDPAHPLILLVHGSGPDNSSLFYNYLTAQLLALSVRPFFYVSVDCPGYGRSVGADKQTIRSYPAEFLSELVAMLTPGRPTAHCLVGSSQVCLIALPLYVFECVCDCISLLYQQRPLPSHSNQNQNNYIHTKFTRAQGAAAVFNALVARPHLAHYMCVMDPVSHDPSRFTCIAQPALLLYDVDDAGHPVSVGRIVKTKVQNPVYFEFASSQAPDWLRQNMARELLRLFESFPQAGRDKGREKSTPTTSMASRLDICLFGWV
jgi:hypothetical protein